MTLKELRRGDKFRIEKVTLGGEVGKRLVDMGLNSGIEGEMLRCALAGDPIEIRVRDYNLSLRLSEAEGVEVVVSDFGTGGGHGRGRGMGRRRGGRFTVSNNTDKNKGE